MERLGRAFYDRPTVEVAKGLLGKRLVRGLEGVELAGIVVEVEAYGGYDDPASHAFRGMTPRNAVMFGDPGHSYVYFTYGNHYCLNVTTEPAGVAGAVLIRALEPTEGIGLMKKYRGTKDISQLTSGPGKLTRAMKVDLGLNGEDLVSSRRLYLTEGKTGRISWDNTSRVGVSRGSERQWRFFVKGCGFVSKGRPSLALDTNP